MNVYYVTAHEYGWSTADLDRRALCVGLLFTIMHELPVF